MLLRTRLFILWLWDHLSNRHQISKTSCKITYKILAWGFIQWNNIFLHTLQSLEENNMQKSRPNRLRLVFRKFICFKRYTLIGLHLKFVSFIQFLAEPEEYYIHHQVWCSKRLMTFRTHQMSTRTIRNAIILRDLCYKFGRIQDKEQNKLWIAKVHTWKRRESSNFCLFNLASALKSPYLLKTCSRLSWISSAVSKIFTSLGVICSMFNT